MNIAKLVAMTSVVVLISSGSNAQTPEQPAAWRVECTGDGKVLDCRAVQQLFQRDTRQLVLSILVRQPADAKTAVMMIQLPLGLSLTEPVLLKVDNGSRNVSRSRPARTRDASSACPYPTSSWRPCGRARS